MYVLVSYKLREVFHTIVEAVKGSVVEGIDRGQIEEADRMGG